MTISTGIDVRSLNPGVDPTGSARGPHQTFSGITSWINSTIYLLIALVMAGGAIFWCRPAQGAELSPAAAHTLAPGTALDFNQSVNIAINQSPVFKKSSIEIDIKRMDETDSRYDLVPSINFHTYYYINRPDKGFSGPPYSLSFTSNPYNPWGAYYTLQAQKLITQVAILTHLKLISKGLESLGRIYLKLDTLNKQAADQKAVIKLLQEKLTYVKNRLSIGTGTSLELKVAQQELQLAQGQQKGIALSQKQALVNLKNMLGLPASQAVTPDFRNSKRQVLGNFDPATASLERGKKLDYELKAAAIRKELQGYKITLAIVRVLPTILFTTQTPDPLNNTVSHGLYVGFGLELPVWDGLKRVRNISRQKAILRQIEAETKVKENSLEDKWLTNLANINGKRVAWKNARSLVELARLKAHQQEIRYQSGEVSLPVYLDSRKEVLDAQKDMENQALIYKEAVLEFREISGDLGNTYVHTSSWQE